ncbi:hypothetical protein BKA62DRAFT_715807 [Auriculariales sp. MPI-PUGE-AT-0066]|nr:hypothetical protein BKA62DRAFT_715807 [Auriculariales sp. MPI-PUGE-AT-0066]
MYAPCVRLQSVAERRRAWARLLSSNTVIGFSLVHSIVPELCTEHTLKPRHASWPSLIRQLSNNLLVLHGGLRLSATLPGEAGVPIMCLHRTPFLLPGTDARAGVPDDQTCSFGWAFHASMPPACSPAGLKPPSATTRRPEMVVEDYLFLVIDKVTPSNSWARWNFVEA